MTTLAGSPGQKGSADGLGSEARFDHPFALTADASGNLFVVEASNHTIRKITPGGLVTTLAGLAGATGSNDGAGSAARFNSPRGIAVGAAGNVYVSDSSNHTIRMITPAGEVTTLAGVAGVRGTVDATSSAARFSYPGPLSAGAGGNLYVAESFAGETCRIRTITPGGTVTTLAGQVGVCGSVDGTGSSARLSGVTGLAVSPTGTAYFLEVGYVTALRAMAADTTVTTMFPASGPSYPSQNDGAGAAAQFLSPGAAAFHLGEVWVTDGMKTRRVTPGGVVRSDQQVDAVRGVAFDSAGTMYLTIGCGVQKGPSTLAGAFPAVLPEQCGSIDGAGTAARFSRAVGLAVNNAGTVYVADNGNSTIRAITPAGDVTTLAGLAGNPGSSDGAGSTARFSVPAGLVVDGSGDVYVADSGNHTIRRVTPAGVVTTFAGVAATPGSSDGTGSAARFSEPYGLTIDGSGNLFVSELGNSTIRRITPAGEVTTIGGLAPFVGRADGVGAAARFSSPKGIAADAAGTLYVVDSGNYAVRQGFLGSAIAPTITTQPASQSVAAGQTVQFTVAASGTPQPGYRWQVQGFVSGESWLDLPNFAPFSGVSTPTLTLAPASPQETGFRFRCVITNLAGTATSEAATLTVSSLTLIPFVLTFGATKAGAFGDLITVTPAQTVSVSYNAPSVPVWTATVDQPWLQVFNGSGTGAGHFVVRVINPANVIGSSTSLSGSVTVTAVNVGLTATIAIALRVQLAGTSLAPVGVFDTPVNNATIQGSIAVTGWALDDVGVERVEIWRDRAAGETTPVYTGSGPGDGKIFIANALFVSGARPDVERLFRNEPQANRAGWGYLMLTWGLWNLGNGPFTLYAFAYDANGHYTTVGTKTVTANNAGAIKPFGALDTPTYGQTVTGAFWNYGWALTPNPNAVDTRTCAITNGNVFMAVDSGALTPVIYGDLRTDIAASFHGFSNGTNAGGAWLLDSTALSDGVHQIGWYVVDSCGRADGIGSRFFTVLNGSSLTAADAGTRRRGLAIQEGGRTQSDPAVQTDGAHGIQRVAGDAPATTVTARTTGGEWRAVPPSAAGVHVVAVGQSERVEVHLPPADGVTYTGAQIVNGETRALPLGSSLDAEQGIFYWQPAAGFLGGFDLAFTRTDGGRVRVRVVVGPSMRLAIDTPADGVVSQQTVVVAGWAIDLASTDGSGIDTVHVWAYPTAGGDPVFLGVASIGDARPDVAAIYGQQFERSSFSLVAPPLALGTYDIVVYPHRAATNAFDGAQVVRVTVVP
ncbi:MAG: hypothetical protein A3H97_14125 [Acidobacteria bacterium RIFCSPLOWO2_02_FULL_65_29]|nr:MAG: hypothetical protein A3H97_14125 [Acidobacteria bacterium RIFCSPLOWO2_02_FULL_65_29]